MSSDSEPVVSEAISVDRTNYGCLLRIPLAFFFSLFALAGCVAAYFLLLGPVWGMISSQTWQKTPCTITKSQVVGNDSLRIDIHYTYEFNGQLFQGDRYNFITVGTSGRTGKERVVKKYPVGAKRDCYVNPRDPSQAVLYRGADARLWWGLFPLPFLLVGFGGLYYTLFWSGKSRESMNADERLTQPFDSISTAARTHIASNSDYDDDDLLEQPGPVTLKSESHRLGWFIGLFLFTCVWNGFIVFGFADEWRGIGRGNVQWFALLFSIPFFLAGIGMVIGTIYMGLSLFNPTAELTLSRQLIPLAGTAQIGWQLKGNANYIRKFLVTLEGREEATYRRGTSTYTDTETFYQKVLFESSEALDFTNGQTEVAVPSDTMHSFEGGNNKIRWCIRIQGEIPLWPDVDDRFPIRVVPHE